MTNEEKLKEIERGIKHPFYYADPLKSLEEDAAWLINRVKVLTEALEFYAQHENELYLNGKPMGKGRIMDSGETARKALNDTGYLHDEDNK